MKKHVTNKEKREVKAMWALIQEKKKLLIELENSKPEESKYRRRAIKGSITKLEFKCNLRMHNLMRRKGGLEPLDIKTK